jgi:nucleotide-binding universal stress UspA family protein
MNDTEQSQPIDDTAPPEPIDDTLQPQPIDDTAQPAPIVVGFDGSAHAHDALAVGAELARATGFPLVLAGAYGPAALMSQEELEAQAAEVGEQLRRAEQGLPSERSFAVERTAVPGSSAPAALHDLAEALHPYALVLGSCHRGPVGRVLIGSVAERLLHGAPCPVVVAPRGFAERDPVELRTVCVGFDGRAEGWTALQRAAQIAAAAGARLRIVMALPPLSSTPGMPVPPPEVLLERDRWAELELGRAARSVAERLEPDARLVRADPETVLARQAERDVDLLVTGSRGYGPLRRVLLGSVSTALMRSASCPVMVVPRTAEFQPTGEGMAAEDEFVSSG